MSSKSLTAQLPTSLAAERHGSVAVLKLNRPQKRNALDDETIIGIEQFFTSLPEDIGAVLIAGDGEHFSAGLDLTELKERNVTQGIAHSGLWHRAFDKIQFGKVPVVAVLHGAVVGGGLELAASAHVRVAERSAYYALPEGSRGIYVGGGGSVRLPPLIGVVVSVVAFVSLGCSGRHCEQAAQQKRGDVFHGRDFPLDRRVLSPAAWACPYNRQSLPR